ncbi:hypothetical protein L915_02180 [Phytophthora nicotianae]|uniref:Uncharacterized protein n=1 Tax=Phytophthora nicotianae TaxID=4792 RepID=W2HHU5_PHYNI|nr:hypothetical protein L915_02180 [Phytophthora nicotianae]
MLLLVQKEVGQIMGRTLTKSENHAETETLLQSLVSKMGNASDGPRICVCDNANANRNLIERVFGDGVEIKQEPFYVITRFTGNVSDSSTKRWLAGQLSAAIYDVKRNLRPPEDCKHRLAATLKALDPTAISVKQSEWEGCVASNFVAVISMLPRISILKQGEKFASSLLVNWRIFIPSSVSFLIEFCRLKSGCAYLTYSFYGCQVSQKSKFEGTNFRSVCQTAVVCSFQSHLK